MPDKKTFTEEEKNELLISFGQKLDDKSCRILEFFMNSKKDPNKLLDKAYQFKALC